MRTLAALVILMLVTVTACTRADRSALPQGGTNSDSVTTTPPPVGPSHTTTAESNPPGIRTVTLAATADCGGKPVKVVQTEETAGVSGSPVRLQVVGDDGHVWLDLQQPGGVREAWFARAGAPSTLLFLSSDETQSSWLRAYRCSAMGELMKPVTWDGLGSVTVRAAQGDDQEIRVVLSNWHGQDLPTTYRYEDGGLAGRIPEKERTRLSAVHALELAPGLRITVRTLPDPHDSILGGPLLVQDEAGQTLLELVQGVSHVEGVRTAGDSLPLLVVVIPGGGSMGEYYEAYRYDKNQDRLVRVPWKDQDFVVSTSGLQQAGDMLRTTGRADSPGGWRRVETLWQYRDGVFQPSARTVEASAYPSDERTVLLMAFDASFRRLADEVPRYFADAGLAQEIFAGLTSQIPTGGYPYCGTACQPEKGPVFVWWVPEPPMKAPLVLFRVESAFQRIGPGPKITALTFSQVSLAVPDAGTARQVLQQQPELRALDFPEPIFQAGDWTTMVPGAGFWRVDPLTGKTSRDSQGG